MLRSERIESCRVAAVPTQLARHYVLCYPSNGDGQLYRLFCNSFGFFMSCYVICIVVETEGDANAPSIHPISDGLLYYYTVLRSETLA